MGDRPIIGVTGGYLKKNDFVQGPYTHQDYVQSLFSAGAVPIILPIAPNDAAESYEALCDGFVFSGGSDVDPRFYGEPPSLQIDVFNTERDASELLLMKKAIAAGKPVFGICRGLQVMNVAFGGTLIQDLPSEMEQTLQHVQKVPRVKSSHSVRVLEDSRLCALLNGRKTLYVNSLHHQAIKTLAGELRAVAFAPDGIIEAAEHATNDRIFGVQWHPESMAAGGDGLMSHLFRYFVEQCAQIKKETV
ncbi:gamma-glutamyl-gamma-aminobutyrate hydrolase family protein [Sporolactobacillus putidus]|uniref:Peptidase C26 n=1 Tax=Sporolactobacillus putidus TaxID=492735 RepID=A0A917W3V1_9BACL|nr:gamma-glutamyl-gamma-aminobutyrate hydrolase family protein [Sporolactobacillus putidus]GGL59687.1 peptidase C26 [Sporolactobacillus putidus]